MLRYGLLGGWDTTTLEEKNSAVALSSAMQGLTRWGIDAPTALGVRSSPLNKRFPITNRNDDMLEAKALTDERVKQ